MIIINTPSPFPVTEIIYVPDNRQTDKGKKTLINKVIEPTMPKIILAEKLKIIFGALIDCIFAGVSAFIFRE
ncbi:MAG: hypothetical protein HC846_07145 [Blastocatellia bacterium]|nr:hypothetical protein [Blastocatellia bacterium]